MIAETKTDEQVWTEVHRSQLTPKEANGVRNCLGAMWDSYVGKLLRKAGYEYPEGPVCSTAITDDNQIVIKVKQDNDRS